MLMYDFRRRYDQQRTHILATKINTRALMSLSFQAFIYIYISIYILCDIWMYKMYIILNASSSVLSSHKCTAEISNM